MKYWCVELCTVQNKPEYCTLINYCQDIERRVFSNMSETRSVSYLAIAAVVTLRSVL